MKKVALALLCICSVGWCQENWFTLKDFGPVTQRLAVTLTNPADAPNDAALIDINMGKIRAVLPDARAGQIVVVDPTPKPAPREFANLNFIPFQVRRGELIFELPLAAHEKKTIYLYTAPKRLNLPGFPAKTGYDARKAYHSFENQYVSYRIETGPGANTTGMAIDCWGKTRAGIGLRNVEAYQEPGESYHEPAYWGMDILKVGGSPGIGGVYLISGNKMARPNYATEFVDCLFTGPVETRLRVTGPVELNGKTYQVTRILNIIGDDRTIHDEVSVTGDDVRGIQLGVGIRNFDHETWTEDSKAGYAMVAGDANQSGYKSVAIGMTFDPAEFARVIKLKDETDGGRVYVFNPSVADAGSMSFHEHRLTMIWDRDGQIDNPADFQHALVHWTVERDHPIQISLGKEPEVRDPQHP